jgi:hypothetical protein
MDTQIRPYRIDIPQADLDDLRERLTRTRWALDDPCPGDALSLLELLERQVDL